MTSKFVRALAFTMLLAGCGILKTVKLMKQGEAVPDTFTTVVPFVERMGLMVVKVRIHGVDYDFMVDSGAPNVVTKELAASLGLTSEVTHKVGDSQGKKNDQEFVVLDSIGIGDVTFLNTGAVVADLLAAPDLACFHISGLIGANLMRKAVWDIDNTARRVTISDHFSPASIPPDALKVPFWTEVTGTPKVGVRYNERWVRSVTFDLGSSGGLTMDRDAYEGLIKDGTLGPTSRGIGAGSIGLYGSAESDSLIRTKVSHIAIGKLELANKVVEVVRRRAPVTLGRGCLKNYRTIMDWSEKTLWLVPQGEYKGSGYRGFGFNLMYEKERLLVGSIVNGSKAEKEGLKVGDEITELNGMDRMNMAPEDWCAFRDSSYYGRIDTLRITVLRNEERVHVELGKEVFIAE